jgi:hypothetical protein
VSLTIITRDNETQLTVVRWGGKLMIRLAWKSSRGRHHRTLNLSTVESRAFLSYFKGVK